MYTSNAVLNSLCLDKWKAWHC